MYVIKDEKVFLSLGYDTLLLFLVSDTQSEPEITTSEPPGKTRGVLVVALCSENHTTFKISWHLLNYSNPWFDLLHNQGLG